jgi:heme/copper-type cytochrome/quinol oxidase subunit 2
MPSLFGIFEKNQIYQWFIGLVYIAVFWLIVYADMSSKGLDDSKKDSYAHYKGFIIGLFASIPGIILYVLAVTVQPATNSINWFSTALRVWLVPYTKIFITFEKFMPDIAIIPVLLFPLVSGISYIDGIRKRKKILKAIEKSDTLKAQKSKVNISL